MRMSMRAGSEASERTTVTLPIGLALRLRVDAEAGGRSVSSIVREALEAYYETRALPSLPSFTGVGRSGRADTAERAEEILAEIVASDFLVGNLAERDDGVLVVVPLHRDLCPGRDGAGAVAGQEHELEAVGNLIDAILDGNASHQSILVQ